MKNLLICLCLFTCLMLSCHNQYHEDSFIEDEIQLETPQTTATLGSKEFTVVAENGSKRKVIRTADYRFQVEDVEKSTDYIKNVVATFSGYISKMDQSADSHSIANSMEIKLPTSQFDDFLNTIIEESIFTNFKRINTKDVTLEYVDIQARLSTKKIVRDRYASILRDKAGKVHEVLEAEEKIRAIQEEIEAKEAQLKYLQQQVRFSSIQLEIYQKVKYRTEPIVYEDSFPGKLKASFSGGMKLFSGLLLFLVRIWPLLLIGGAIIFWQRKRIFKF